MVSTLLGFYCSAQSSSLKAVQYLLDWQLAGSPDITMISLCLHESLTLDDGAVVHVKVITPVFSSNHSHFQSKWRRRRCCGLRGAIIWPQMLVPSSCQWLHRWHQTYGSIAMVFSRWCPSFFSRRSTIRGWWFHWWSSCASAQWDSDARSGKCLPEFSFGCFSFLRNQFSRRQGASPALDLWMLGS